MDDRTTAMFEELKDLLKVLQERTREQEAYIKELKQQMSDMKDREYDC